MTRAFVKSGSSALMGSNMREPFGISVALALHQREVRCLQLFGDRTATAFADRTIVDLANRRDFRSEEHTSELQSLMRISYAVFCLKKKNQKTHIHTQ